MNIFAIDIGGTFVKYGVWNEGKLKETNKFKTPDTWDGLTKKCKEILATFQESYSIEGVAVSAPGAVDAQTGLIGGISAVSYIHEVEFQKELESILELPVKIENDANCAALAESWLGVAKGFECVLFVVLGTGVGGAIINQGKINHGANLYGGEFGLMVLDQGKTFSDFTISNIARQFSEGKDQDYSGEDIFHLAEKLEDKEAQDTIEKYCHYTSLGIYNLLVSYNPDRIVIGGGISDKEGFISELSMRVQLKLAQHGVSQIHNDIVACYFRNDANLIGAVSMFMDVK